MRVIKGKFLFWKLAFYRIKILVLFESKKHFIFYIISYNCYTFRKNTDFNSIINTKKFNYFDEIILHLKQFLWIAENCLIRYYRFYGYWIFAFLKIVLVNLMEFTLK